MDDFEFLERHRFTCRNCRKVVDIPWGSDVLHYGYWMNEMRFCSWRCLREAERRIDARKNQPPKAVGGKNAVRREVTFERIVKYAELKAQGVSRIDAAMKVGFGSVGTCDRQRHRWLHHPEFIAWCEKKGVDICAS